MAQFKDFFKLSVHVVMIQSHEHRVRNNAEQDEQFEKWVKDYPWDTFLQFQPTPTAVPDAELVDCIECLPIRFVLHCGFVFIFFLFFIWEIVNRRCNIKNENSNRKR